MTLIRSKGRRRVHTLAIQRFDRTAALHTGLVTVDDLLVSYTLPPVGVSGLLNGSFEAAEIPVALYTFLCDRGAPYTAVPVFPDRIFVQQYVYTRPDTGIRSLADLRGRRVCVPLYFMTASFWHRGLLKEHGILPREIEWFTTTPEWPGAEIPEGVRITMKRGPHLGLELLLDGTVDCLMTEATPMVPESGRGKVVALHPELRAVQSDYFRRTGFHPSVHVIAVRKAAAEERPELLEALCEAFDQAKQSAYSLLQNERTTGLPLMRAYVDETVALFGDDPWPYGLEGRNRAELDQFLAYASDQGLTRRRLTPEDLFDPPTRDFRFRSRMVQGADLGGLDSLLGTLPGGRPG